MDIKCTKLEDALKAVKEKGDNIQYCIPELVANIEVLKEAVKNNYFSMQKIQNVNMPDNSGLIINNKKLMFELIKVDPRVFIYLGDKLKDDEEIVDYCVSSSRYAYLLKYAGEKAKANRNIVLKAVTNTIYSVDTAFNNEIKNDKEIALKILSYRNSRINLTWFGDALKSEINNALGYDITEKPIDLDVMADVEKYLKTKIQESEKSKLKSKEEIKQEVKPEVNIVTNTPNEEKTVIKSDIIIKKDENSAKSQNKTEEIEQDLTKDFKKLDELITCLHSKTKEIDELKLQINNLTLKINNIEKDIDEFKIEVQKQSNVIKQKVLSLR